ncbi:MAG: hypothetical protein ACFFF4_08360 [Candidatus Thorarchaeota archaeon]
MKPLGTITIYLPFVDAETKQLNLELMEKAENYSNFSKQLTKYSCSQTVNELSVYLTVHHAMQLYDFVSLDELAKRYADVKIIQPSLYFATSYLGNKPQWEKARKVADEMYQFSDSDWIKFEMLYRRLSLDVFNFSPDLKSHESIEKIEDLLKENPELKCFEYRFHDLMAQLARVEGNHEEAIRRTDIALKLAQSMSDEYTEAHLHRIKAQLIQRADHKLAEEHLRIAQSIIEDLGDEVGRGNVLHQLGVINAVRGQYNSAIEYSLEAIRNRERLQLPFGILASNMATLYNAAGDYENGLSWAELAEEELSQQSINFLRARLVKAWSIACRGKVDEAKSIVDETRENILRSGMEPLLAQYYFTSGLIEFAQKDYSLASSSFEQAYDINRRLGRAILDTVCLYYLARCEVISAIVDDGNRDADTSGHWLRLLEEVAESKDLSGIKAQSILLYSQFRLKQGRMNEAKTLLQKIDQYSQESGMKFLQNELRYLKAKLNQ